MGTIPEIPNGDPVGWPDTIEVVAGTTSVTPASFFLQNDSDPEGDPFWVTRVTYTEGHGTVRILDGGTPLDTSDDSIEFIPSDGFTGETSFYYTITDAYGGERAPTKVTVTVLPGNDPPNTPPVANPDAFDVYEDGHARIPTASLLRNDQDTDGDPLIITAVGGATNGSVSLLPDGTTIHFIPNSNFSGAASFTYTISDGQGGTATATAYVNVISVNDAPTLAPVPNGAIAEQPSGAATSSGVSGQLMAMSVEAGAELTYGLVGSTPGSGDLVIKSTPYGQLELDTQTGAYVFVQNDAAINELGEGEVAFLDFTFRVTDDHGLKDIEGYRITVAGANDAPTLAPVTSGSIEEQPGGGPITSDLSGQLVGADPDGDLLTYALQGATTVSGNTVSKVTSYGEIQLDTDTGSYVFTQNDGAINGLTASQTVTESFTFEVRDPFGGVAAETYEITLTGASNTPTLEPVTSGSITDGPGSTVAASSGLTGTLAGSDLDGDTLIYGLQGRMANSDGMASQTTDWGTLTLNTTTGAYDFVLDAAALDGLDTGETAKASFTFEVSDGQGGVATQAYDVNITGANDAPVLAQAIPDQTSLRQGSAFSYALSAGTFSDVDGEALTLTASGLPSWLKFNTTTQTFSGTPTGAQDKVTVTVTASDGTASVSDSFELVIGRVLNGGNGNDRLTGGVGNDLIRGNNGNDNLSGAAGADRLWGDQGNDTLTGGAGPDVFVFGRSGGDDRITDFTFNLADPNHDRIALDGITLVSVAERNVAGTVALDTVLTFNQGSVTLLDTGDTHVAWQQLITSADLLI